MSRELRPLPVLVEMVSEANCDLEALCELLRCAEHRPIGAEHIHTLLAPIHAKLTKASCDLNDMRI